MSQILTETNIECDKLNYDNVISTFAMKRNRHNKKMTLLGFVSHGRIQWTESIYFRYLSPFVIFFYHGYVSANAPVK